MLHVSSLFISVLLLYQSPNNDIIKFIEQFNLKSFFGAHFNCLMTIALQAKINIDFESKNAFPVEYT